MEKQKFTVEVRSVLDRVIRSKEIEATEDQMDRYYRGEEHVQNIFPDMDRSDREFLISGIDGDAWDKTFGPGPGEDDDGDDIILVGGDLGGPFA